MYKALGWRRYRKSKCKGPGASHHLVSVPSREGGREGLSEKQEALILGSRRPVSSERAAELLRHPGHQVLPACGHSNPEHPPHRRGPSGRRLSHCLAQMPPVTPPQWPCEAQTPEPSPWAPGSNPSPPTAYLPTANMQFPDAALLAGDTQLIQLIQKPNLLAYFKMWEELGTGHLVSLCSHEAHVSGDTYSVQTDTPSTWS